LKELSRPGLRACSGKTDMTVDARRRLWRLTSRYKGR
jgi:hypothetical protein